LLIDAGAEPNARGTNGQAPLHRAVSAGRADVVELLLSRGARNWIEDAAGKKPVDFVKDDGSDDARKIRSLLSEMRILNPHFRDAVSAIDAGDVARLKQILREHPNLVHERAEEEGWFAGPYFRHPMLLHFVANNPNRSQHMPPNILESTRAILDAGAAIDAVTESDNGGTTLALVATSGPASRDGLQIPLIELLVARGADSNTGLDGAMIHHELNAVKAMLRLGAKHTLSTTAGMGEVNELRRLLQPSPDAKQRLAAAQVAATLGQIETLQLLLDTGLDVNARLPHPFSPTLLHQAAWYGHASLVDALLARGADPTARDTQYNSTPADWARVNKHPAVAERIERKNQ
jgi:peptide-methionine (S)-S-oxide reductase